VAKCHTAPKPAELRLPLSIAATLDLEIEQLDVRTAFLEGTLDEDVSVPQSTDHDKTKVLKLVKALNGTKQAPRVLNDTLNNYLVTIEFKRCVSDPCIYVLESESGEPPYYLLGVYVDDIIIKRLSYHRGRETANVSGSILMYLAACTRPDITYAGKCVCLIHERPRTQTLASSKEYNGLCKHDYKLRAGVWRAVPIGTVVGQCLYLHIRRSRW
jgi:hypothetical protein